MKSGQHGIKIIAWLLLGLMLTACGFQLTGNEKLPQPLQDVYINVSETPHSTIAPDLISALQSHQVHCVKNPTLAHILLNITQDAASSQQIGSGASQETRQYQLNYTVTFTLITAAGKVITGPVTVTSSKIHYVYSGQVLGNNEEEETLYRGLRRDVVQKILFSLSSAAVVAALTPPVS